MNGQFIQRGWAGQQVSFVRYGAYVCLSLWVCWDGMLWTKKWGSGNPAPPTLSDLSPGRGPKGAGRMGFFFWTDLASGDKSDMQRRSQQL